MTSLLDPEELLHLALVDSREGRHDLAIAKLKQALFESPYDAKIQYMLAAEYAEIGIQDRAVEGMARAIELDPTLTSAQLQLGLIHFSAGDITKAREAWLGLDSLGPDNVMVLFKEGLLLVGDGRLVEALPIMRRCLAVENSNAALAQDISRILSNLERHLADSGVTVSDGPGHLFANKYDDTERGGNGDS